MPKQRTAISVQVEGYERLPKHRQPAGYVCIFVDSKSGNHLIENCDHPRFLVKKWEQREAHRYSLVRVVKTDNAVELKKAIHQRFKDNWLRPHRSWFRLDIAQLREFDSYIEQMATSKHVSSAQLERWKLRYFAADSYKNLPRLNLPKGYVYVAKDLYTENFKIGYTNHPDTRIQFLESKASGAVEYVLILQSDDVRETESYLHERFDLFRTSRFKDHDWFRLNDAHLKSIESLASQWPHKRQSPSHDSSSNPKSDRIPQTPAILEPVTHHSPQKSREAPSPEMHRTRDRRTDRKRSRIGLVASIGVIFVATYVVMLGLVNVPELAKRRESTVDEADTPTRTLATITTFVQQVAQPALQSEAINRSPQWASCKFVYSCPSFDCKPVGQLATIDELLFNQCVEGQTSDAEWIQLTYKNDKAYLKDRDCSSRNYSKVMSDYTVPQGPTFTCDCTKECGEMASCAEAFFQLNDCGCSTRDSDEDGIPCESLCQCD